MTNQKNFSFDEAMNFIMSFSRLGKKVNDLSRVKRLIDLIDNPQNGLEFIHIAGTNGKGSVAEMLSEILCDAGIKTGTFTSPYIVEFRDRIRLMGKVIPKDELAEICCYIKSRLDNLDDKNDFSGFEITMAIALLYFKKSDCEAVVFETGLGGLLDCTNVIKRPLVSVITSISHDHTAILGKTIREITRQKAGIIKNGCPVVLSINNPDEAVETVSETAKEKGSKLIIPDKSSLEIKSTRLGDTSFEYKKILYSLSMSGEHQITNALTAIETAYLLQSRFKITEQNIQKGLKKAFVIGRTEILASPFEGRGHYVILDGSHNDGGVEALSKVLKEIPKPVTAIVGSLKRKNVRDSLPKLFDSVDRIVCVDGFTSDTIPKRELCSILNEEFSKVSIDKDKKTIAFCGEDTKSEFKKAMNGEYKNTVICGTLYLVSYIKNL